MAMALDRNTDTWRCAVRSEWFYKTLELAITAFHKTSALQVSERLSARSTYHRSPVWSMTGKESNSKGFVSSDEHYIFNGVLLIGQGVFVEPANSSTG